jgi:4-carboxymuconolactone decarboxylase
MSFLVLLLGATAVPAYAQEQTSGASDATATQQQSRAQQLMGDIAPKLADLTDEVLYGDVWERSDLSKRDRSLVTVAALIALNRPDQLRSHLALARRNGVTEEELVETITHLAFYSGWPNSVSAVAIARDVFREN